MTKIHRFLSGLVTREESTHWIGMGPTVHWNSTWRCPLYSLTVWVIQGWNSWYTSWISSPWQPNTHFLNLLTRTTNHRLSLNHLTLTTNHRLHEPSYPDNQTQTSWIISPWQPNTDFLNHLNLTTTHSFSEPSPHDNHSHTFWIILPWQPEVHFLNHLTLTIKHWLSESSYLDNQKYTFWTISPWQLITDLSERQRGKACRRGRKAIKHIYN